MEPDLGTCPDCKGYGAQGWSLSLVPTACDITAVTTSGTDVPTYYAGGFNKTQVVDPTKLVKDGAAGVEVCDQDNPAPECYEQGPGAVSAVVLSFTTGETLPENGEKIGQFLCVYRFFLG